MSAYETLSDLRTTLRGLIGRSTTAELSDSDANELINWYLQNVFPEEAGVSNFQTDFNQDLAATDDGDYTLAQTVVALEEPVTIDGTRIDLYTDKESFFDRYQEDEHYVTPPTLAIGTSDTAAVANAAFKYRIAGQAYSKAVAETSLSGSAVPANTYGAWLLTIDTDGTITVTEADDNATGYASSGLAVAALATEAEASDEAVMGYVTVLHTSAFTPGTTGLDTAGVTDTYTDGRPGIRNRPEAALVCGNLLSIRPRPDDWYRFQSRLSLQRPTALSEDSDVVGDVKWGKCIAVGAALLFLADKESETERMNELAVMQRALLSSIRKKQLLQWSRDQRTIQPGY